MKVDSTVPHKCFEPFSVSIRIESEADLIAVAAMFGGVSNNNVMQAVDRAGKSDIMQMYKYDDLAMIYDELVRISEIMNIDTGW